MARIHMEGIVEELGRNFSRVLKATLDEVSPGNAVEEKMLLRIFRTKLERGFERWEYVPNRCVDSGD